MDVIVVGAVNFGGGINVHTEYQLRITTGSDSWVIFRRYKDFDALRKKLQPLCTPAAAPSAPAASAEAQESSTAAQTETESNPRSVLPFPEKSYRGSFLSSTKAVTAQRCAALQDFLRAIISHDALREHKEFSDFLDVTAKGETGVAQRFGQTSILKEIFANCKITQSFFGLWSRYYVVLMKDGTLYILNSVYDIPEKSQLRWNLKNPFVRITPSNSSISIKTTDDKRELVIGFESPSDAAFWIRMVSDLSLGTGQIPSPKKTPTPATTQNRDNPISQPSVVVRAQGTGNTEDELSAMYGI